MRFNKFFVHKLNEKESVLITDAGNRLLVSEKELAAVKEKKIPPGLLKKLEEKKIIATPLNRKRIVSDYRALFSHLKGGVSLHIINPTMRCNHNCLYCYANSAQMRSKGCDMDAATAKKTVDFIWQSPAKGIVIEFQGGEPLANFETIQFIMGYAKKKTPKKKVHWRVVSNLSLMDGTIAQFFKSNGLLDVCTSLDGPAKVHDKNRPLAGGSHKKVSHWVESLRRDFGFPRIGALCTVTKNSLPFAEEIVGEYLRLGLPDITPVPVRHTGRAKQNWGKIGITPEQYAGFWKQVAEHCLGKTKEGAAISEQYTLMIARKFLGASPAYHSCFSRPCGGALMQASYQPDGSIFTCDEGKTEELFRIGSVSQKYPGVFASPAGLNMVSLSGGLGLLCNECKWLAYCSFCPVCAYAETGSPVPLLYRFSDCKIRQAQFPFVLEKILSPERRVLMQWLGAPKGKSL